jgi:sugar phosphate isomerase/epimerase
MQNFERKNRAIREAFLKTKAEKPEAFGARLNFSWSNWGFGLESLETSVKRLSKYGVRYIELHGNKYGPDLGYKGPEVRRILSDHGLECSGICGMFSAESELASNRPVVRQNAVDYLRRNLELGVEMGARYFLIAPSAVGRPEKIDDSEFERSVETLQIVAHLFEEHKIRGAVEPIRSAEVSIVHTFAEAARYIEAVASPGVQHINGDIYHMQVEEDHIAETIWRSGESLTNLHLADSNRCALGEGSMDLDTLIMALYLVGYNNGKCFATAEPLGPGGDPYPAMYGRPDEDQLDNLVSTSVKTWNEREEYVRGLVQ